MLNSDKIGMNILSLNVRGINDFKKRRSVFYWIRRQNADIAFLQETYSSRENENMWRNEWGGRVIYSHGTKHSRGLAIFIKNKTDCEIIEKITEQSGRILMVKTKLFDDTTAWLVNVYAPNDDNSRTHLFRTLEHLLLKNVKDNEEMIIGGDFNVVLNEELDKKGGKMGQKSESRKILKQLIESLDLVDIWRVRNPNKRKYTWRQPTPPVHCRLDYFLISNTLQDLTLNADVLPSFRSDHSGIYINIKDTQRANRGRGYWKFNSQLLSNDDFTETLKRNIEQWKTESNFTDNRLKWEWLKYKIRLFATEFSKKLVRSKKDRIDILTDELRKLEVDITENNSEQIKLKRQEVEQLMSEKTEGIILRSKVRWYEQGEKSTKYFYNLEKRNHQKKTMKKLNVNGIITEDPKKILEEQRNFYEDLYTSKVKQTNENSDLEGKFLHSATLPKLSDEDSKSCEGLLSNAECYKALKTFEKNKSPGNDGLTAEFYMYFWPYIGELMVRSFNTSYDEGQLTVSQRQAVITLLEKPGKDRTLIKNWRPISLLNTDYKIATKALAMRLTPVLPTIIHPDQSGYVKNRNIIDSIRSILDISEYSKKHKQSGLLLSLDFQKAFDSLEHRFMIKALKAFNFGESFIKWVRLIYTDVYSCIINNGHTSQYFGISRGVRQGDPLSAFLFIIALEILSHAIRQSKDIEGVKVGQEEKKLVQFADDTSPILKDKKSLKPLFKLLDEYAKISGLTINTEKTEVMWIGTKAMSTEQVAGLPPTKTAIKLLGVFITHNENEMMELNMEQKLRELSATFNLWNQRNLTIEGRILLAKSLGCSKFNYIASVIHITPHYQKRIESCLYKFIWKGGGDKVKRTTIIRDYKNGGLKMLDQEALQKKLSVKWVQHFLDNSVISPWKSVLAEYIKPYGDLKLILTCNFDEKELFHYLPQFYQMVVKHWKEFYQTQNNYGQNVIWYNKEIKINGRCIFEPELDEIGVRHVTDLYSEGKIIPFNTWVQKGLNSKIYFKWRSVISSIQKTRLTNQNIEFDKPLSIKYKGKEKEIKNIDQRDIYNFFLLGKTKNGIKVIEEYKNIYNLTERELETMFLLPRKCTVNCKLRELQYKVIHKYLPTNEKLFKYKLIESNTCDLCHLSIESIKHLFWDCPHSKTIWLQFSEWWTEVNGSSSLKISESVALFGTLNEVLNNQILLFNHMLLIIKKYIFENKTKQITFDGIIQKFSETKKIEYEIARGGRRAGGFSKEMGEMQPISLENLSVCCSSWRFHFIFNFISYSILFLSSPQLTITLA